jgi:uncharacterized membrane protein
MGTIMTNSTVDKITSCVSDNVTNATSRTAYMTSDCIAVFEKKVEEITKTPEVRPDTNTKFDITYGKIYVKHYKDGFFKSERYLIPDITDVKVHGSTVLVTFADNTKSVAVLDNEDDFNLEQGISICITKKLLGESGNAIYNKLIKRAFKVIKNNEKVAAKKEKEKAEAEQRKAAALKRHQKKQAKKREARIEEMAEAYVRAIERLNLHCDIDK